MSELRMYVKREKKKVKRRDKKKAKRRREIKDVELKLICELMKDSRRSDRDLAKVIETSQPTVTRTRTKLEKEGYIKEYTMIPDFQKLKLEIMAITFVGFARQLSPKETEELRQTSKKFAEENPTAVLMAMNGMGLGCDRVFVSFHKNYSSYMKTINVIKQIPSVNTAHVESFVVSLLEKEHFQPLTFKTIADFLLANMKEDVES
ncbi:MAG: Lrp/AsnC family transcriptional regulator [Candidatus Bathyarchaeota archaeon]|nr:Lrp/AsnC family transcriptional regulator [Candidatus Bathyarchaeota archaeon]MDH5787123.1 Lrp/AsnC family transcriptional regulator [Candidatus Bathyarchaeota archaeon]